MRNNPTQQAHPKNTRGVTLIEMLVYTSILVLLVVVVIYTLITMNRLYRSIKSTARIESAVHVALERMVREVRGASSIDLTQSTLGSSPGQLTLNTTDGTGATTTVQFLMTGQTPHIKEAGVDMGPLSPADVRVTNLIFRRMTTAKSEAAKIEITIESGAGATYRSASFYSTAVLRGSYPLQ